MEVKRVPRELIRRTGSFRTKLLWMMIELQNLIIKEKNVIFNTVCKNATSSRYHYVYLQSTVWIF